MTGAADAISPLEDAFRRHHAGLVRLAVVLTGDRCLAEELAQEAFVRFHRSTSRPPQGAELAYLRRTVLNLSHDHQRGLARFRRRPEDLRAEPPGPEAEVERRDRQRRVADAVRTLPARQRDCVVLHYDADLTDFVPLPGVERGLLLPAAVIDDYLRQYPTTELAVQGGAHDDGGWPVPPVVAVVAIGAAGALIAMRRRRPHLRLTVGVHEPSSQAPVDVPG